MHVFEPLSIIHLSILVYILTYTVSLIVLKLAHEDVTISVIEASFSFGFSVAPLTNILGAVWPSLSSKSVLKLCVDFDLS